MMQKICYLLYDLVDELQRLYELYCANENITDNKKMKYFLQKSLKSLYTPRQHVEFMETESQFMHMK